MKVTVFSAFLSLLISFAMAYIEMMNWFPHAPMVTLLYVAMTFGFMVGLTGLCLSIIKFIMGGRFYLVFNLFMLLCITPILAAHYLVSLHYRWALGNDISTNNTSPPAFYNTRASRRSLPMSEHLRFLNSPQRVDQHPYLKTTEFPTSCHHVSKVILSSLSYRGWLVNFSASTENQIEATASFFFVNNNSDMVIRTIDTSEGGCAMDVRSSSRNNFRDWGQNILLIDRFMETLTKISQRQGAH